MKARGWKLAGLVGKIVFLWFLMLATWPVYVVLTPNPSEDEWGRMCKQTYVRLGWWRSLLSVIRWKLGVMRWKWRLKWGPEISREDKRRAQMVWEVFARPKW